jgi:hypothetical protein
MRFTLPLPPPSSSIALCSMAKAYLPSGLMARPSKPRFVRLPAVLPASLAKFGVPVPAFLGSTLAGVM